MGRLERVLLDTSVLIQHLRQKQPKNLSLLEEAWNRFNKLYISTISYYEIEAGAQAAGRASDLEQLIEHLEVLPITTEIADEAASIFAELNAKNQKIPHQDILIAAVARHHQLPLLTYNLKHFSRVRGIATSDKVKTLVNLDQ